MLCYHKARGVTYFPLFKLLIGAIEQCWNLGKRQENGKIKLKKVVFFFTFLTVFSAIFGIQPIRTLDLIEIND